MNATHPAFNNVLKTINPYTSIDAAYQRQVDEEARLQDWRDQRLEAHYRRYLEDGDLADAISTGDGIQRGFEIFRAVKAGENDKACLLIEAAMEIAAQEYAASKVAHEELCEARALEKTKAQIKALRFGRIPAGY